MDQVFNLSQAFNPVFGLKIVFLILLFLIFLLAIVIFNQIRVMNDIIKEVHSSFVLRTIALLNIIFVISLFLFVLVILR